MRWKPLCAQAIGWEPNLNDDIPLNFCPFMCVGLRKDGRADAGILLWKLNVKWGKNRGTELEEPRSREDLPWFWDHPGMCGVESRTDFEAADAKSDGKRWSDLHYTNSSKRKTRKQYARSGMGTVQGP